MLFWFCSSGLRGANSGFIQDLSSFTPTLYILVFVRHPTSANPKGYLAIFGGDSNHPCTRRPTWESGRDSRASWHSCYIMRREKLVKSVSNLRWVYWPAQVWRAGARVIFKQQEIVILCNQCLRKLWPWLIIWRPWGPSNGRTATLLQWP